MKTVMAHDFSKTPTISAPRSTFSRPFGHKFTMNAGELRPFYWDDILPGDTFTVNTSAMARLATPLNPIMDNMYMDTQYFFVPLRLIWDNARKFFGEQANPADSTDYTLPLFTEFTPVEDDISDTLGLPPGNPMVVTSIYHRACSLIWNEWYRDQNLQDSIVVDTDDGPDDIADYVLQKRGKRFDYFTSALPWPQKGDAVNLPLGTSAPVATTVADGTTVYVENPNIGSSTYSLAAPVTNVVVQSGVSGGSGLYADLTSATAATINELREAFQVQKFLERNARGGTRYSELVKNHFGVDFYDASYRPEYLGGGSTPIKITPVAQSGPTIGSPNLVGDLGGFGTASFSGHGFTKSFVEHGIVIGFISARADLTYQQGINRSFNKRTIYDFYWPSLAHLGEQEILNKEIYYQNTAADDEVFGYQERYAEYRYKNSMISGKFRSVSATSLDPWHLSQEFASLPTLGPTFITEDPPMDRVVAVPSEPDFIVDTLTSIRAARAMPLYGVPGMIDHF